MLIRHIYDTEGEDPEFPGDAHDDIRTIMRKQHDYEIADRQTAYRECRTCWAEPPVFTIRGADRPLCVCKVRCFSILSFFIEILTELG